MGNTTKDLSVLIEDTTLNIRVVVLLKSEKGYVFEKSKDGYLFALGGRVKLHESTIEACAREILEEIHLQNVEVNLAGVVENFFAMNGTKKYHEINFVFKATLNQALEVSDLVSEGDNLGYVYILPQDFHKYVIKPISILELINSDKTFMHLINRE